MVVNMLKNARALLGSGSVDPANLVSSNASISSQFGTLYRAQVEDYFKYRDAKRRLEEARVASEAEKTSEEYEKDLGKRQALETRDRDRLMEYMHRVYLRERPLVAVDVEAHEHNLKKVTEIGISVYDPEKQHGALSPVIFTVHILVEENKGLHNGRFVPDNKYMFCGGVSHQLQELELQKYVQSVMRRFITAQNGVLVGHHILGDLSWLRLVGVAIPEDVATVETSHLFRMSRSAGGTLRGLLRQVHIPHGYLHNAANDAYYTLLAAMAYCDPAVRMKYDLDSFEVPDVSGELRKARLARRRSEKFSDRARVSIHKDGKDLFYTHFGRSGAEDEMREDPEQNAAKRVCQKGP